MRTIDHLIGFIASQDLGRIEQQGHFVDLRVSTKRAQWNKRRNYGI